jgi:hypothetical protein
MNRSLQFIKKQREKLSLLYPTSNPVDSTDLKERQTNSRNKETHRKLSWKVDPVSRCPDRKLSMRRMT